MRTAVTILTESDGSEERRPQAVPGLGTLTAPDDSEHVIRVGHSSPFPGLLLEISISGQTERAVNTALICFPPRSNYIM